MVNFLIRRFLQFIPTLIVISIITFVLMKAAPGGPWDRDAEQKQISPKTMRLLELQYGLNKPLWRQWTAYNIGDFDESGAFVCGAICGNLGPSFRQRGLNVEQILFQPRDPEKGFWDSKFGYSLRFGLYALLFAVIIGIPAGVVSALKQNSAFDYLVTFLTNIGISVPSFVVAFFSIVVFAVWLGLTSVRQDFSKGLVPWILPSVVFGFGTMSGIARLTRASILDVMRQDYVRTARAKGAVESAVIWRHMLSNALIPVITILGPALAGLVTGSIVMEQVYGLPGVGVDFIRSIGNRDYSLIMGTTLFYAVLILLANLSVDIMYGVADPRIRVE
jgi:oligopeptide transport system permease protein